VKVGDELRPIWLFTSSCQPSCEITTPRLGP
jgi:hypothetical protein